LTVSLIWPTYITLPAIWFPEHQAINFFFKKGHRVIGMINGPEKLYSSQERREGYIGAMTKSRLKFDPVNIISTDLNTGSVFEATRELCSSKRKPTAIVTFNDYVALDAINIHL
jgi:LacI family transcriptional regulator, repressor for deo operon, udp, cdd, tsx, nupC, and nupG